MQKAMFPSLFLKKNQVWLEIKFSFLEAMDESSFSKRKKIVDISNKNRVLKSGINAEGLQFHNPSSCIRHCHVGKNTCIYECE